MKFPKKIKSEKMAVKYSIIMWQFLADNPDKGKADIPWYVLDTWSADCALCEYYSIPRL